jgi:hypothetical protein
LTSCKKEKPTDGRVILNQATFDNNAQYQVPKNATIYTSSSEPIGLHNIFLDLSKFAADNNNVDEFYISGTINFGILVGFNENINLYGEGGLINVVDGDTDKYGIMVGSTDSGSDTYTGNMYIDESVTVKISSVAGVCYGVYIDSQISGDTTINGNFYVRGNYYTTGVKLGSTGTNSTQNINGNFVLDSMNVGGVLYGVIFTSTVYGYTTINGNFL